VLDLRSLADAHSRYLHVLISLEKYANAEREVEETLRLYARLRTIDSENADYQGALARTLTELIYFDLVKKDINKANDDVQRIRELWPRHWSAFFSPAFPFVAASEKFKEDAEFSARCRTIAFDFLNKAVELGFEDVKALREDSELDPIRDDSRFSQLISRITSVPMIKETHRRLP
jgi:hypothetical protein